jgi:hypothetical protein
MANNSPIQCPTISNFKWKEGSSILPTIPDAALCIIHHLFATLAMFLFSKEKELLQVKVTWGRVGNLCDHS